MTQGRLKLQVTYDDGRTWRDHTYIIGPVTLVLAQRYVAGEIRPAVYNPSDYVLGADGKRAPWRYRIVPVAAR